MRKALAAQLGIAGIVCLTRLQSSPYHVTYRGQPLDQVLYFADLLDGGKGKYR